MEELAMVVYKKYFLLHWLITAFGVWLAYLILMQVKRIFSSVDEEMWGNNYPERRYIKKTN